MFKRRRRGGGIRFLFFFFPSVGVFWAREGPGFLGFLEVFFILPGQLILFRWESDGWKGAWDGIGLGWAA